MNSKYMKEIPDAKEPLKDRKATFKLIRNENWQPPRKPKKRIRVVTDKELPPAA
jgi:hypothetical protein